MLSVEDNGGGKDMFIKVVPNNRGAKGTYYCSLVCSYREGKKVKHQTIKSFGLLNAKQVEALKSSYRKSR